LHMITISSIEGEFMTGNIWIVGMVGAMVEVH